MKWTPEFYVPARMRANPSHGNKQASVELPPDFDHEGERASMIAECRRGLPAVPERGSSAASRRRSRASSSCRRTIYTQAYWTVSLQGVIHFLSQRLKPEAQFEIRRYAEGVYDLVADDLERIGISRDDFQGE